MAMYLGPLGGLREINPLHDFPMSSQRFGGVHESITGRRTVDVLGHRATVQLRWVKRNQEDMEFLEAIHHRLVPGPLRLVFPTEFRKNRLSRSAASAGYGSRDVSGVDATGGELDGPGDWQPDGGIAGQGLTWTGFAAGNGVRFDRNEMVPVVPGESLSASVWVKSSAADGLQLVVDHYDSAGAYVTGTAGTATTLVAGTWTRLQVTATPGAGIAGLVPGVYSPTLAAQGTVTIGGAQVELGTAVTAWTRGGGALVVAADQMNEQALWSPYTNPELTLLEL